MGGKWFKSQNRFSYIKPNNIWLFLETERFWMLTIVINTVLNKSSILVLGMPDVSYDCRIKSPNAVIKERAKFFK